MYLCMYVVYSLQHELYIICVYLCVCLMLQAYLSPARKKVVTDEKKVLSICEQKEPISIDSILPSKYVRVLLLSYVCWRY